VPEDVRVVAEEPTLMDRESQSAEAAGKRMVAISATFTAEPIESTIRFWLDELDMDDDIQFAPYNQVFQQLLDPSSLICSNREGLNIILARIEDWAHNGVHLATLESNVFDFIAALSGAARQSPAPFLVILCPGSAAFLADAERAEFAERLEEVIAESCRETSNVQFLRPKEILAMYPVEEPRDPHSDRLGHVPYTQEFFAALGTAAARRIHAIRTEPFKVIALDCDQTLWKGVCGEDGPAGIVIDEPRRALQQFMVDQQQAGMLLCLTSKNNEADVWETFAAHPEMPLQREHLVGARINWESKSQNLRELADELELGLDSFILVDDSPTECAEVEANRPEVLTLRLPKDAGEIPRFLANVWAFDHISTTEEDRLRTAMYGQRLERRRFERQVTTMEEFLRTLDLRIEIGAPKPEQLQRVAQLTQRTNQMNLTSVRRTEGEIRDLLESDELECLAVHVEDRFGSYGLVGVVLYSADGDRLNVDTFLLSCRALGRGVEHRMLARLGEIAAERGLANIDVRCARTPRNEPARNFLRDVAGKYRVSSNGESAYKIPASEASRIAYDPQSRPGEPGNHDRPAKRTPAFERAVDYARIANALASAGAVFEHVRRLNPAEGNSKAPQEQPRTQLERQLAGIWREMLHAQEIGVHDNFFDLGGHSLLAVQLLSRVREAFQVDLSLDVVFSGDFTIAELAKAIEIDQIEHAGAEDYAALLEELEGLSDEEVRALIEQEERGELS